MISIIYLFIFVLSFSNTKLYYGRKENNIDIIFINS